MLTQLSDAAFLSRGLRYTSNPHAKKSPSDNSHYANCAQSLPSLRRHFSRQAALFTKGILYYHQRLFNPPTRPKAGGWRRLPSK
jgi:hypothetical protein